MSQKSALIMNEMASSRPGAQAPAQEGVPCRDAVCISPQLPHKRGISPSALASSSSEMGSSLGGSRATGVLGSNLPDMMTSWVRSFWGEVSNEVDWKDRNGYLKGLEVGYGTGGSRCLPRGMFLAQCVRFQISLSHPIEELVAWQRGNQTRGTPPSGVPFRT